MSARGALALVMSDAQDVLTNRRAAVFDHGWPRRMHLVKPPSSRSV